MSRFAIGDIHGCIDTLQKLIEDRIKLTKNDKLFFVGDYIDRGKNSKAVLDYLIRLQQEGYQLIPIKGNHEEMMLKARFDEFDFGLWLCNDGDTTLRNFGIRNPYKHGCCSFLKIPDEYIDFINELPYFNNDEEDFFFVHAGINFNAPDPLKDYHAMVWLREENYNENILKNKTIIHGHTPVNLVRIHEIIKNKDTKVINIDAGCVYASFQGLGNLVAINLDTYELFTQPNID